MMCTYGDNEITMKHRSNVALENTSTKLPIKLRLRLHSTIIASAKAYGSSALILTVSMKFHLKYVNLKLSPLMTKRIIHEEAKQLNSI